MAFRDFSIITPNTPAVFQEGIFNVDQAVGSKEVGTGIPAANRLTDMMLVYYFLFTIYRSGSRFFPNLPGDGFQDPRKFPNALDYNSEGTKKNISTLILRYQKDLKRQGQKVFADGRCDRGRGQQTTVTHSKFTIHLLNVHYQNIIEKRENRTDWQDFLLNDSFVPAQLRQELATNLELG